MKKKIIFVCEGNSIRSIMAEAVFNKLSKKYIAQSAGTFPAAFIDSNTKKVLDEIGLRPSKKEPTPLKYDDIVASEKVILMHKKIPNFPKLIPQKLILQWDVKDCVGKSIAEFKKTRDLIVENVKELVKKLE